MFYPAWLPQTKAALRLSETEALNFVKVWDKTRRGKGKYPIDEALTLLAPYIDHWYNMIQDPLYPKDSQYLTLLSYLGTFSGNDRYYRWRVRVEDLRQELILIAANLLVKNYSAPVTSIDSSKMQYAFAYLFTGYLFAYIRFHSARLYTSCSEGLASNLSYEQLEPDYFLLDSYLKTTWDSYMCYLLSHEYTFADINTLLKLPKNNINYHEVARWEQLKVWR